MRDEILTSHHTVMSYELDSFGHVNNAVFLNYLEKARNDCMIAKGLRFGDFFELANVSGGRSRSAGV